MYLTYFDDGGKGSLKVFGGIVLEEAQFTILEGLSGLIAAELVPPEGRANFEFHASDLFAGEGSFTGIDEAKRHKALRELIGLPAVLRAPYVYSAIDIQKLQKGPMRSARWVDTAFFMCACAVENTLKDGADTALKSWIASDKQTTPMPGRAVFHPLNVMIIDEPEQEQDRGRIRSTFRELRVIATRAIVPQESGGGYTWSSRLPRSLDDVFFGSSSDSLGLQIADACNWAMWRHLTGVPDDEFFRELISAPARVIPAKPEPEWTEFRHLFRAHDESA